MYWYYYIHARTRTSTTIFLSIWIFTTTTMEDIAFAQISPYMRIHNPFLFLQYWIYRALHMPVGVKCNNKNIEPYTILNATFCIVDNQVVIYCSFSTGSIWHSWPLCSLSSCWASSFVMGNFSSLTPRFSNSTFPQVSQMSCIKMIPISLKSIQMRYLDYSASLLYCASCQIFPFCSFLYSPLT